MRILCPNAAYFETRAFCECDLIKMQIVWGVAKTTPLIVLKEDSRFLSSFDYTFSARLKYVLYMKILILIVKNTGKRGFKKIELKK